MAACDAQPRHPSEAHGLKAMTSGSWPVSRGATRSRHGRRLVRKSPEGAAGRAAASRSRRHDWFVKRLRGPSRHTPDASSRAPHDRRSRDEGGPGLRRAPADGQKAYATPASSPACDPTVGWGPGSDRDRSTRTRPSATARFGGNAAGPRAALVRHSRLSGAGPLANCRSGR